MTIELITAVGEPPLVLDISQFVVRQDNGTPIAVGAEYGPAGAQAISMVGMSDFARMLQVLGIHNTVVVDRVRVAGPQKGAKLWLGPAEER